MAAMTPTIEDIARENDMPPWLAAEVLARLIRKGLVAAPETTTAAAHVEWLERTYPRPQSTVGAKRNTKEKGR